MDSKAQTKTETTRVTNPNGVARRKASRQVGIPCNRNFSAAELNTMTLEELLESFKLPRHFMQGDEDHEETTLVLDEGVLEARAQRSAA